MELTNKEVRDTILHFKQTRKIPGLILPFAEINTYNKILRQKGFTLEIPNVPRIIPAEGECKMILLNTAQIKIEEEGFDLTKYKLGDTQLKLNYKNFDNQQILDWFTKQTDPNAPSYVAFPGSFQTIGHIAHYNLTEEQEKWKVVIGEITLLKCPNIKTVVNKTQKLHNVYRTPTLEHMSGELSYQATLKERGVEFRINFQKVYWCSRLQQERDRLLQLMRPGEVLLDLFCGVGPVAVRAAKKNLYVIANDLNPYCYEYLQLNAKINKVQNKIICWNMCARQAMRKIYKEHNTFPKEFQGPDHIYMNLPVDAIQFLDVLADYQEQLKTTKIPLVHVNCFVVADSQEKSRLLLTERIKKVLPNFKAEYIEHMHHIKNVTVIMRMYCISIRLGKQAEKQQKQLQQQQENDLQINGEKPSHKKLKTQ